MFTRGKISCADSPSGIVFALTSKGAGLAMPHAGVLSIGFGSNYSVFSMASIDGAVSVRFVNLAARGCGTLITRLEDRSNAASVRVIPHTRGGSIRVGRPMFASKGYAKAAIGVGGGKVGKRGTILGIALVSGGKRRVSISHVIGFFNTNTLSRTTRGKNDFVLSSSVVLRGPIRITGKGRLMLSLGNGAVSGF